MSRGWYIECDFEITADGLFVIIFSINGETLKCSDTHARGGVFVPDTMHLSIDSCVRKHLINLGIFLKKKAGNYFDYDTDVELGSNICSPITFTVGKILCEKKDWKKVGNCLN